MKIPSAQYRNQRLGRTGQRRQQHLLDVSIRRDKERALRIRRLLTVGLRVFVVAFLAVGVWFGTQMGLQRFLWQNPWFYLSEIHVTPCSTLTREQILLVGDVRDGMHYLSLDAKKVHDRLARLPQVERVEVTPTFPHRLDIEVTERQPVAWLTEAGNLNPAESDRAFLIDTHGYVMKTRKMLPEYEHLPIIHGAILEDLAAGQRAKSLEIIAALELLRRNNDSTRWQVRHIDISRRYCLVVKDRSHGQLIFGLDNMERQLGYVNRLLDYADGIHKEIQTANLLVERNVPVTFYDPATEPPEEEAEPAPGDAPPAASAPAGPAKPGDKGGKPPEPEKGGKGKGKGEKAEKGDKPKASSGKGKSEKTSGSASPAPKSSSGSGERSHSTFDSVKKPFRPHG